MSYRKLFFLAAVLFFLVPPAAFAQAQPQATLYYSAFCSGCTTYIENDLTPLLQRFDIAVERFDYITDTNQRLALQQALDRASIPREQAGHMMLFFADRPLVLGGHVPLPVIEDLLRQTTPTKRLYVLQDEMHGTPSTYRVFSGTAFRDVPIATPIFDALTSLTGASGSTLWFPLLLFGTALLDGINPCAFAVLLFFIAFLYTLHRRRANILAMGFTYIAGVYLAYLLIGLGLLKAILFTNAPHAMAIAGATLLLVLGLWHLLRLFVPAIPFPWKIPTAGKHALRLIVERGTIPAAFVGGFLVGLCTFPCSGGPYVAILTLLATTQTYAMGLLYLLLYNFFFVLPLFVLLGMAGNQRITTMLMHVQERNKRIFQAGVAILLIVLALLIFFFFIP